MARPRCRRDAVLVLLREHIAGARAFFVYEEWRAAYLEWRDVGATVEDAAVRAAFDVGFEV